MSDSVPPSSTSMVAQRLALFDSHTNSASLPSATVATTPLDHTNPTAAPTNDPNRSVTRASNHVRRNSAPKGAVSSLLSFWRDREKGSARSTQERQSIEREANKQDARIEKDRRTSLIAKEAKTMRSNTVDGTPSDTLVVAAAALTPSDPAVTAPLLPKADFFSPQPSHCSASTMSTVSPFSDDDHHSVCTTSTLLSSLSPTPTLPPPSSISLAATTEPVRQTDVKEDEHAGREQSEPIIQTNEYDADQLAVALAQQQQQLYPAPPPLLTRTVTDVGEELALDGDRLSSLAGVVPCHISSASHSSSSSTLDFGDQPPLPTASALMHHHHPSHLSVGSVSSCNTNTFNFDGQPLESPSTIMPERHPIAHYSGVAGVHRTHDSRSSTSSLLTCDERPVDAPQSQSPSSVPPLTREVTDHIIDGSVGATIHTDLTLHPDPTLAQIKREITDFQIIGGSDTNLHDPSHQTLPPAHAPLFGLPLMREVTDLGSSVAYPSCQSNTAPDQHAFAAPSPLVPLTREVTDLCMASGPAMPSSSPGAPSVVVAPTLALPRLTREVTDLGGPIIEDQPMELDDRHGVSSIALVGSAAPPPLMREVTDLGGNQCEDELLFPSTNRPNESIGGFTIETSALHHVHDTNHHASETPAVQLLPTPIDLDFGRRDEALTPGGMPGAAMQPQQVHAYPIAPAPVPSTHASVSHSIAVHPLVSPLSRIATDPHMAGVIGTPLQTPHFDTHTLTHKPLERIQTDANMIARVDEKPHQHADESLPPTMPVTPDGVRPLTSLPLLTRVQTELNLADVDPDAAPVDAAPPSSSSVSATIPLIVPPSIPSLTRVQTELELSELAESQPEDDVSVPTVPAEQESTARPPMLTRMRTQLERQDANRSDEEAQKHSKEEEEVVGSVGPPLLHRVQTEIDVTRNNLSDDDDDDATTFRAPIEVSSQPPPVTLSTLPTLQRVQTELDLQRADEEDTPAENDNERQHIELISGLTQPTLTRLVTDPLEDGTQNDEEQQIDNAAANSADAGVPQPIAPMLLTRQTTDVRAEDADVDSSSEPTSGDSAGASEVLASESDSSPGPLLIVCDEEGEHDTDTEAEVTSPAADEKPHSLTPLVTPPTPSSLTHALHSPLPIPPSPSSTRGGDAIGSPSPSPSSGSGGDVDVSDSGSSRAHLRKKVESELLSSEETYVSSLGLLVKQFIHPLKTQCTSLDITPSQVSLIFGSIELLYNFHIIFLDDLKHAIQVSHGGEANTTNTGEAAAAEPKETGLDEKTPTPKSTDKLNKKPQTVSDIFNSLSSYLKMYTQYLAGYTLSLDTIASLRSNSKFQQFLLEQRSACDGRIHDITSYLILPVQRIPRYLLLLKEILRFTPSNHPELVGLQSAYRKVQEVALHINEQQRHVENMSVLLEIQNTITSGGVGMERQLMMPHRRLIRSGVLDKLTSGLIASSHPRKVYLFNDMLIWCEPSSSSGSQSVGVAGAGGVVGGGSIGEKFRGHVDLAGAAIREYFSKGGRTGFRLSPPTQTKGNKKQKQQKEIIFLCLGGTQEKIAWLTDIRAASDMAVELRDSRRRRMESRIQTSTSQGTPHPGASKPPGLAYSCATLPSPKSQHARELAAAAAAGDAPRAGSIDAQIGTNRHATRLPTTTIREEDERDDTPLDHSTPTMADIFRMTSPVVRSSGSVGVGVGASSLTDSASYGSEVVVADMTEEEWTEIEAIPRRWDRQEEEEPPTKRPSSF